MPISREEFEAGKLDLTVPIRQLLEANPEFAFSAEEIVVRLSEIADRNATVLEVAQQLDDLVQGGVVDSKELGGQMRYIIILTDEGNKPAE